MTHSKRFSLEHLEDRWVPAVTASLKNGVLAISGAATSGTVNITQSSTTAGTITVEADGAEVTGSPFTGVNSIRLNLTSANDTVNINLGGQTLSGNISASLGAGANTLTVVAGTLGGRLSVSGLGGVDTLNLGDGKAAVSVKGLIFDAGDEIDVVNVRAMATVKQAVTTFAANQATFEAGSTVKDVYIEGGYGGNTINLNGDVTGNVYINAFTGRQTTAGTTVNITGDVDGNVGFLGSKLADTFNLTGSVGKSLAVETLGGDDVVTIGGTVTRSLYLDTAAGTDQITLSGTVGGRTNVYGGAGDDKLTVAATANLSAQATVALGAGNDTATVNDTAKFGASLLLNGGTGTDVFTGTATKTGLTLVSF